MSTDPHPRHSSVGSPSPTAGHRKKWRWGVVILAIVSSPLSCTLRWPPKRYGDWQKSVTDNNGNTFTLTLWSRARVVKGPFFDGSSMYVRLNETWGKVDDGEFGSAVGQVFVAPSRDFAFVERRLEGGRSGGVMIDLSNGSMEHRSASPDLSDWTSHSWHTRFELENREELHQQLLSGRTADVETAKRELEIRGITSDDLPTLAHAFLDTRLPNDLRHHLVFQLTKYDGAVSESVLATIAKGLDDRDRQINLSAAFALGEITPDAPESVDIWYGGSEEMFRRKYDRYVPAFRDWWQSRAQASEER